jgi:hypothetical protein
MEDEGRRVDALAQGEAGVAGDQRLGQDEVEVVLLEAALGPHLDHVAEALGGDEGGAGAARSISALVASVVPWMMRASAEGGRSALAQTCRSPSRIASSGAA